MKTFVKILCLILCLSASLASLSACFDTVVDFATEAETTAGTDAVTESAVPSGSGSGLGTAGNGSIGAFLDPSWTVKTGFTVYHGEICILRSAFDNNGRLVAEVYNSIFLNDIELNLYFKYEYDPSGSLQYLSMYDYKMSEVVSMKFQPVGDRRVESVSIYEGCALVDEYSAVAEHYENGMLKEWYIVSDDYEYKIEYDGLGRRVSETSNGKRFEPKYNGDTFEISECTFDGYGGLFVQYTNGVLTSIGENDDLVELTFDASGNLTKALFGEEYDGVFEYYLVYEAKYDSSSRVVKITESEKDDGEWVLCKDTNMTYDAAGKLVTLLDTEYDDGEGSRTKKTEFKYNPNGTVSREHVIITLRDRTEEYEKFYNVDGTYDRTEYYTDGFSETLPAVD